MIMLMLVSNVDVDKFCFKFFSLSFSIFYFVFLKNLIYSLFFNIILFLINLIE